MSGTTSEQRCRRRGDGAGKTASGKSLCQIIAPDTFINFITDTFITGEELPQLGS